jgi:hypothetical protein
MRLPQVRLGLDRPWAQWSVAALSLLVIGLGVRTMIVAQRLRQEIVQLQRVNRQLVETRTSLESRRAREEPRVSPIPASANRAQAASLVLSPGLAAGATPARFSPPDGAEVLHVELALPPGPTADRYKAGLRGAPGDEFLSQGRLRPAKGERGAVVRVLVPADALAPGNYELSLQSQDASPGVGISYYYFEITRR